MMGRTSIILKLTWCLFFCKVVSTYTCKTPDTWFLPEINEIVHNATTLRLTSNSSEESDHDSAFKHHLLYTKWPGGLVKYKLHDSLTLADISVVKKAFEEYHTQTCIRFVPWQEADLDFISIEVDNNECGKARVCKRRGYQYVRFGNFCRNVETMIHELGHSLCLEHENQRVDRGDYIHFQNCQWRSGRKRKVTHRGEGIYDYASQMHYECDSCDGGFPTNKNVKQCGFHLTPGLSLLNVDHINELYDCQGCKRHRWISAMFLTHRNKTEMENFGLESPNGSPLYPCRVEHSGEVFLGNYEDSTKTCFVAAGTRVHGIKIDVEVLTFPKGLHDGCYIYKFIKADKTPLNNAVPAGTSFTRYNVRTYLASGSTTTSGGVRKHGIGYVGVSDSHDDGEKRFGNATLVIDSVVHELSDFKVLTCSLDKICMVEQWYTDSLNQ